MQEKSLLAQPFESLTENRTAPMISMLVAFYYEPRVLEYQLSNVGAYFVICKSALYHPLLRSCVEEKAQVLFNMSGTVCHSVNVSHPPHSTLI